ncbi:MAG: RNA methyltransferase [Myxococcota bacterium]|jgi:23S rRNA (guanosine2251-2'-O)-methyltransferase|nr:RNA methyltransferase [Myxococcota bacterium]
MASRSSRRPKHSESGPERLHGRHVIAEALVARRRALYKLLVRPGAPSAELARLIELAKGAEVPVVETDPERLVELAGETGAGLQGALLEAGALPEFSQVSQLLIEGGSARGRRVLVVLDGVEDPQNVGGLARVADAAGASGLVLARRRSPPLSPALARASAGAIERLPVARVGNLVRTLEDLKKEGFWVVAADPEARQELFTMPDRLLQGDLAVVLGAEGRGLRTLVQATVDHPVRIPMRGQVASLNVATAGAVVLFELLRREEFSPSGS